MFVYSGQCRLCECGLKTDLKSIKNEELRTGDIVLCYTTNDDRLLHCVGGLTVVICNQWQTYSNGEHKLIQEYLNNIADDAFVMGIKGVKLGYEWEVELVKRFEDVIIGEHWKNFGFSFNNL